VPYYKQLLDASKVKPDDIRDVKDLHVLPCLTREDVRNNYEIMVAKNMVSRKLSLVGTSGTTGIPLTFFADESVFNPSELAFIVSLWNRAGYRFDDKCVRLTGIIPRNAISAYDSADRQLKLSPLAMTNARMHMYTSLIRKFRPKFILGNPSYLFLLGRYMKENAVPPISTVKALLLRSEPLYGFQRRLLGEVFQCRVFSWYGHNERTVLAGECECSTCYHLFPEYGVTELIGRDGEPITEEGEPGEIVGTGFLNWVTPFIRYKTNDIGVYTSEKCECGRNYVLLKSVEGRAQEYLVASDDSLIPFTSLMSAYEYNVGWTDKRIKQIQFLQDKKGEIVIRVVKDRNCSDSEVTEYLLNWSRTRFGKSFKGTVNIVKEIPPTRAGKYRYFIQKLPIQLSEC
jgi:phenylacetate-CoA ligase